MITKTSLLEAIVSHKRYKPVVHAFSYKIFFLSLNLKAFHISPKTRLFSINRWNIYSLFLKDYRVGSRQDPILYIKNTLNSFNFPDDIIEDVVLITMPRLLGYVFNPISFWLCFNKEAGLHAVFSEVNNTFGERHTYLCFKPDFSVIESSDHISCKKLFHVSPFCEVKGEYDFRFALDTKGINIDIIYKDAVAPIISAHIRSREAPLTDKTLLKYLFIYPLIPFKVIFAIHYHALCLWLKRVPYFKKPPQSLSDIS